MRLSQQQQAEIEAARAHRSATARPTVPALEDLMFQAIPVLDHGFIRVIDYMGDDGAIVQAARVSYGRGTRRVSEDAGLIRYLMRHHHSTPFEMCEIKYHVKLPIFVARQWIRHRTANVNEYSARYSILDREFYLPAPEQLQAQSSTNRQGREAPLTPDQAAAVLELLRTDAARCYDHYEQLLNEGEGGAPSRPDEPKLARELARMNLTLNFYTQWYWKIDLHNLLHFLALRMDAHAQYEIRVYAEAIDALVQRWVPQAWEAFRDYRLEATTLSRQELLAVKALLRGETPDYRALGLSPREQRELGQKLGLTAPSPQPGQ
jgi:thymidylate synthase (FAD)